MRKIIALISTVVFACSSNAAIITTNVSGVLGNWTVKSWDIATSQVLGSHFLSGNPDIIVQGSISYDDEFEELTALSLSQVGSLVANTVDGNTMTISGLSWGIDVNSYTMYQISGSASCLNASARCTAMAAAISLNDGNSAFDFDGVTPGFKIAGANQSPGDGYGPLTIDPPGYDFAFEAQADQVSPSGAAYNTISDTTINLTAAPAVPVPAAAWLMGSSLIGLTAVARRRRA